MPIHWSTRQLAGGPRHPLATPAGRLAVGSGVGQSESGAPAGGERAVKYNRRAEMRANDNLRYGLR